MKRILLGAMTAVAVSASALALTAAAAPGDQPAGTAGAERMLRWTADHEALLDARLAGMKAGLKLTADQEKLWGPFETAVRDASKARMDDMRQMMQNRESGERMSPLDRLEAMAGRMAQGAAELKTIAEAAKPLYASLDDTQKRNFALLGREMLMQGGGHPMAMMGMGRHHGDGERDPDDRE
jgi:LTXXQ motif family protein